MKTSLSLKIVAVLAYVALCTGLVLTAQQVETWPDTPLARAGSDFE